MPTDFSDAGCRPRLFGPQMPYIRTFRGITHAWYYECERCGTWPLYDKSVVKVLERDRDKRVLHCPICFSWYWNSDELVLREEEYGKDYSTEIIAIQDNGYDVNMWALDARISRDERERFLTNRDGSGRTDADWRR